MENITRNVDDLAAPQRKILEDLLGHQLASNQQVFIMAFSPGTAADDETRNAARMRLEQALTKAHQNAVRSGVTAEEADAAVDEAMEAIRPRLKS